MSTPDRVDFRTLVPGQKFRKLDPFGAASPHVRTFVSCQPARQRNYWVVTVEERTDCGHTVSFQTGDRVELVATGPTVGMDATLVMLVDRFPYRVTRVGASGKVLWAKELKATRTDKNGMSQHQEYTYEEDPESTEEEFRLTKRGWKGRRGQLALGHARRYHCYEF